MQRAQVGNPTLNADPRPANNDRDAGALNPKRKRSSLRTEQESESFEWFVTCQTTVTATSEPLLAQTDRALDPPYSVRFYSLPS